MSLVYAPTMPPGAAFKNLRKSRFMTQEELAKLCGVNVKTIRRFERGYRRRPREQSLRAFAKALGMTLDQLKYDIGLAPFGSQRPDTPAALIDQAGVSPYGPRADRLVLMFLNLTAAQQDYLESVALSLHSSRHTVETKATKQEGQI